MTSPDSIHNAADESVHSNTGSVQITRLALPKDPHERFVAVILSASIIVNIVLAVAFYYTRQSVELDRYDDNTFINGRFADLAAQVRADHDLIQAYGLQKALKEKSK